MLVASGITATVPLLEESGSVDPYLSVTTSPKLTVGRCLPSSTEENVSLDPALTGPTPNTDVLETAVMEPVADGPTMYTEWKVTPLECVACIEHSMLT